MLNVVANLVYANNWDDAERIHFGDYTNDNSGKARFAKHLVEMMDRTGLWGHDWTVERIEKALKAFDSYHRRHAST